MLFEDEATLAAIREELDWAIRECEQARTGLDGPGWRALLPRTARRQFAGQRGTLTVLPAHAPPDMDCIQFTLRQSYRIREALEDLATAGA